MTKSIIIFLSLHLNFLIIYAQNGSPYWSPEVKLPQGSLRGTLLRTASDRTFYAFLGIPYATPPLGQLRFKHPVPHPGWSNILHAGYFRSPCPQHDFSNNQIGDENCLFLNIFTPNINERNSLNANVYPVMVYIQAESFENGDAALYGPQKLVDKGVVVVTFNYRLGILGFLSTDDEIAPGNWGLYDQKMVLDWVRRNIVHFSGDPNAVTLFGQGAGAAAVMFHVLSPLSQGLFHRAILQSGSALCEWALERAPLNYAREIAQNVGCPIAPSIDLIECLRRKHISNILRAQSTKKIFGEFPQRAAPVIERTGSIRFIPDEPKLLLARGEFRRVPLMAGLNKEETLYFYPLLTNPRDFRGDPSHLEKVLLPKFLDATTRFRGSGQEEIKQSILHRYFNKFQPANITDMTMRFINMSTDALYTSCIDETVKLYSRHQDAPTYMYLFAYQGENSMINLLVGDRPVLFKGVCHGDELFYLFDLQIKGNIPQSFADMRIGERILTLWTDFAKYGQTPQLINYEYGRWDRFDNEHLHYYRIDKDLRVERAYRQPEAYFWTHYLPKLYGLDPKAGSLTKPKYKTLAWAMVAVSVSLLLLIVILLGVLYYQRKSQIFRANSGNAPSRISAGSSALY